MICKIQGSNEIVCNRVVFARTILERLRGYMGYGSPPSEGLLIDPCQSVHTFFMFFPLHIIYLNKKNQVIKIYENLAPWRLTMWDFKASRILELPVIHQSKCPVKLGDTLIFEKFEETCIV